MSVFNVNGKEYQVDQEGHLLDYKDWTKEFAEAVAKEGGVILSELHWKIIEYVRRYYEYDKVMPPKRQIEKEFKLSEHELNAMFPVKYKDGYLFLLSKIAGLPIPTGDV